MKSKISNSFQIFSKKSFPKFRGSKFLSIVSQIRIKFFLIVFTILILKICFTKSAMAQKYSEEVVLEEALSEFDDQNVEDKDEDILSGFDDEKDKLENSEDVKLLAIQGSWSNIFGSTGLSMSYSYAKELPEDKTQADWSGFTKVQPFFSFTWDAKLSENWKTRISGKVFYNFAYGMKKRGNFSKEVLKELEQEAEFREFYIEGSPFKILDIKLVPIFNSDLLW